MSTFGTADQGALPRRESPAGVAAARAFWTSMAVGAVALAAASVAIAQLFASWRIGGTPASHEVSLLGLRVSYPAANLAAIAVTVLAGFGLLIAGAAAWGLGRELLADRRFRRALAASSPVALHGVLLIADDTPQAFCAGLLRPRVYVSTGALELLDPAALAAVMAHERHHALRRDPLRVACGRALAAGLFVAVAVLAARTAAGSATLAPPFLSSQPCVVMLALIPLAVAVTVAAQARSRRARRIGALVRE
jgi:Zn-dependent protease with chaperone function